MHISLNIKDGLTLEDLRTIVKKTEQLSGDIPVNRASEDSDVADTKVTVIIVDDNGIYIY